MTIELSALELEIIRASLQDRVDALNTYMSWLDPATNAMPALGNAYKNIHLEVTNLRALQLRLK